MGKQGLFQGCRRPVRFSCLVPGLLAASLAWACDKDEEVKIRVVIDSEVPAAGTFDSIEVMVTASETPEGRLCRPVSRSFDVEGDEDLPVVVYYLVGPTYRSWVAVRVLWMADDIAVTMREVMRPITGDTYQQIDLTFEADCEEVACEDGQQCISGSCEDLYRPDPFVFDPTIMDDVPCDR